MIYIHIGAAQKISRMPHTQIENIVVNCHVHIFFKKAHAVLFGEAGILTDIIQCDVMHIIFFDIGNDEIDRRRHAAFALE